MDKCSRSFAVVFVAVLILAFLGLTAAYAGPALPEKIKEKTRAPDTRTGSFDPPPNDTCTGAIDATAGGTWNDDTSTATNSYNPQDTLALTSCTSAYGYYARGPDVVYKVVLQSGQEVAAMMHPGSFDASIYLITDCNDPVNSCVAGDDSGSPEGFVYCSVNGGTYYIICDGYHYDSYGAFTLDVNVNECMEPGCCPSYMEEYDFTQATTPFATDTCGGRAVWEWGEATLVPTTDCSGDTFTNVLATVPGSTYLAGAGEIAYIGPVNITSETACMDLCHLYYTEVSYDGGNVKVSTDGGASWSLIHPDGGYLCTSNTGPNCVREEPGFCGFSAEFIRSCFDLGAYVGQSVHIGFCFGADGGLQYAGWYIHSVRFGADATAVAPTSWGTIKSMFQ